MNITNTNATAPARSRNQYKRSCQTNTLPAYQNDNGPHHWSLDLEFLHELRESDVLERIKEICRIVQLNERPDRAIRLPGVLSILGISKSSWYGRLNIKSASHDPSAPKPFKLGKGAKSTSAWWQSEVIAYLESCAQTRTAQ